MSAVQQWMHCQDALHGGTTWHRKNVHRLHTTPCRHCLLAANWPRPVNNFNAASALHQLQPSSTAPWWHTTTCMQLGIAGPAANKDSGEGAIGQAAQIKPAGRSNHSLTVCCAASQLPPLCCVLCWHLRQPYELVERLANLACAAGLPFHPPTKTLRWLQAA